MFVESLWLFQILELNGDIGDSTSTITYIHICHNDCCNDWNNREKVGGDIIFNQGYTSDPDLVYEKLQEKKELYPDFAEEITRISAIVFE